MSTQDLLADFDAVDWSALDHAYGPAIDVPTTLRQLQSTNAEECTGAFARLYSGIYHQGSRYSASAAAVPFLYRLLNAAQAPQRQNIVRLLVHLAIGDPTHYWLRGLDVTKWREDVAKSQLPGYCENLRRERAEWVADASDETERRKREFQALLFQEPEEEAKAAMNELRTYDAVRSEIHSIIGLLKDKSAAVRVEAAFALAWFPEHIEDIHDALLSFVDHEADLIVQATALISLGFLQASSKEDFSDTNVVKFLQLVFAKSEGKALVRFASSVALLLLRSSETEHVREVMLNLTEEKHLQEYEPCNFDEIPFPFADPDFSSVAAMALGNVDKGQNAEPLNAIIVAIPTSRGEATLVLANMGLEMAFGEPPSESIPELAALTEIQKWLLMALTEVNDFNWTFANFKGILRAWKLPTRLDQLKALVTGE